MQAIAREVAKRQIRLKERMRDFDGLRCGYVTPAQFHRCLAMNHLDRVVDGATVEELAAHYLSADGRVHYTAFLADLDAAELAASKEQTTLAFSPKTAEDAALLEHATEAFVQRLLSTGMEIRKCFQDFDRHNAGVVSVTQFERTFPFKVESKVLAAIIRTYELAGGLVNYSAWCRQVTAAKEQAEGKSAVSTGAVEWANSRVGGSSTMHSPVRHEASRGRSALGSFEGVMAQLRAQVDAQQIRAADFFRDADKLRTGRLLEGQFQSGLGRMKLNRLHLTGETMGIICDHFAVPSTSSTHVAVGERHIDYVAFLRALESNPAAQASNYSKRQVLDQAEEIRVERILDTVRTAIRSRRMNMKPVFQDFDRATTGVYAALSCTRTRFERALAINGIRLPDADVALLEKKYTVDRPGEDDANAINYVAFCHDVDIPESGRAVSGKSQLMTALTVSPAAAAAPQLVDILDKMTIQIAARGIRVSEFIKEHDPLRAGHILEEKLETALSVSGLHVSAEEVSVLVANYAHPTIARHVAYGKLLHDLDPDAPDESGSTRRTAATMRADKPIAGESDARLSLILNRILEAVRSRSMLLPPFFADYDRHHQGTVTATQFERAVFRHRLPCNPDDVEILKKHYRHPVQIDHVRYRDFISDVDATEIARRPIAGKLAAEDTHGSTPGPTAAAVADVNATLEKLCNAAMARSVRVGEFFRDADPLRTGACAEGKFASAIDSLGVHLNGNEHEALRQAYASTRHHASVEYSKFVRDVEAIEASRSSGRGAIETVVAGKQTVIHTASPQGSTSQIRELVDADPFLKKLFERLQTTIRSRRVSTKTVLQDSDKLRKGRVTHTQFFSALSTLQLKLSDIERAALLKLLSTEPGSKDVNYVVFSSIVDVA